MRHTFNDKMKIETMEKIIVFYQEIFKTLREEENYRYLGILEADAIK